LVLALGLHRSYRDFDATHHPIKDKIAKRHHFFLIDREGVVRGKWLGEDLASLPYRSRVEGGARPGRPAQRRHAGARSPMAGRFRSDRADRAAYLPHVARAQAKRPASPRGTAAPGV
jgi:hypothetical protein